MNSVNIKYSVLRDRFKNKCSVVYNDQEDYTDSSSCFLICSDFSFDLIISTLRISNFLKIKVLIKLY